jgi:hypothetical protein
MQAFAILLLAGSWAVGQGGSAAAAADGPASLFVTSQECMACHNGLTTPAGEDVSIGTDWRTSMMANAARDPYWHAGVRREVQDHPQAAAAIEHECAACHMPMARFEAKRRGLQQPVLTVLPAAASPTPAALLAADGVSCSVCHQIQPDGLGERQSFSGGFEVDRGRPWDRRVVFGPYVVDEGRRTIMRSASGFVPESGAVVSSAEMCASCHTLFTHTLGPDGQVLREFPEQVPYLEWKHSRYRADTSCQGCHLPGLAAEMPITSVWGQPRAGLSPHRFRGGNFFLPRIFGRFSRELAVTASIPELDRMVRQTIEHLQSEAARLTLDRVTRSADLLRIEVRVENLAGHKLPTAYPSRRAWLHVRVTEAGGAVVFESGPFRPDGSIGGNDNDLDPAAFEPHWEVITRPDQVQVYEAVMVDREGRVTTGLLSAWEYVKDNRLLPEGFQPESAPEEIAVRGRAHQDADFAGGGDRTIYEVEIRGARMPLRVEAELWYQPIGYRWARNLAGRGAAETDRLVAYYEAMAEASAVRLVRAERLVEDERRQ